METCKTLLICAALTFILVNTEHSQAEVDKVEKFIEQVKYEVIQKYRLHYHLSAPVGWMGNPSGFVFYKGEYHLFYLFHPYAAAWGPMHWGHVKSPDLVNWTRLPTALIPDNEYCLSGSAVVDKDKLVVMYTAMFNNTNSNGRVQSRSQSQYLAVSENGVFFKKYQSNPVIREPNDVRLFKDPKMWRHGDQWYAVIANKEKRHRGKLSLYRSPDLYNWTLLTDLFKSTKENGKTWESPDFFELEGRYVLLISAKGMDSNGDRFKNVFQTGYILGTFDYNTYNFTPQVEFQELDFGHDFYAAQTTEVDGKRLLIAWFNMWDVTHPEEDDGWSGALTIVRELNLRGNRILMKPIGETEKLRHEEYPIDGSWKPGEVLTFNKTVEVIIENLDLDQKVDIYVNGSLGGDVVYLQWNPKNKKVSVDRGKIDYRQVQWTPFGVKTWRIFLDTSTLELFCGLGEVVFSSRVFSKGISWKLSNLSDQSLQVKAYKLKRIVPSFGQQKFVVNI